ncbi:hypothetical protein FB567DRAFT_2635 [Paraphoma chrysanthemicola]|uniref:F-box domain-containing protein n=1 Tax=Paraphoma chrysanthemicola TaxID=798071 RepID=A0A8K0W3Z8_9PLEO|nr:hypothetical protein FB567DRAFT_2635 [Paraphoma chrysanthemicola]
MAHLSSLPNELLQHIATFLPFSDLLRLNIVCHRLNHICNDRLVLQSVATYGHYSINGAVQFIFRKFAQHQRVGMPLEQLQWTESEALVGRSSSIRSIKEAAHASEQCTYAALADSDDWTLKSTTEENGFDISNFLPVLLALHHPATLAFEPDKFLQVHGRLSDKPVEGKSLSSLGRLMFGRSSRSAKLSPDEDRHLVDFVNINFTIACITLQRLSTTWDPNNVIRLFEQYFFPDGAEHGASVTEDTMKCLCDRSPEYGVNKTTVSIEQASSLILPMVFGLASQFGAIDHPGDLPKPLKMPFRSYMDIPSISKDFALEFKTCHYSKMTDPTFLAGRWLGYYSDQRRFRMRPCHANFDPPMCDIRMVVCQPSSHDRISNNVSTIIDRRSRGVDSHGEFTLEGRICADGTVNIVKKYIVAGWSWTWTAHVTPFGIVGIWGNNRYFGGYFWIWKEDWC